MTTDPFEDIAASQLVDDRLQLMFACCHPALATEAQVALTLADTRWTYDFRDCRGLSRP